VGFQIFDGFVIVKSFVGLNTYPFDRGRQLGKGGLQEFENTGSCMRIARAKFSMPKVFGDPIEIDKRMVGGSAPLFGIVPDPSHLLFAVERKNSRVKIEDDFDWRMRF
jgi:hypothetical protein